MSKVDSLSWKHCICNSSCFECFWRIFHNRTLANEVKIVKIVHFTTKIAKSHARKDKPAHLFSQ